MTTSSSLIQQKPSDHPPTCMHTVEEMPHAICTCACTTTMYGWLYKLKTTYNWYKGGININPHNLIMFGYNKIMLGFVSLYNVHVPTLSSCLHV